MAILVDIRRKYDVLLIHQPLETPKGFAHTLHPIGFHSLAGVLRKNGVSCQIVNIAAEKNTDKDFSIEDYVVRINPLVVGIGIHWYIHLYNALSLAKRIKAIVSSKVIVGGYTAAVFAFDILKQHSFIDAVVDGEGETPLLLYYRMILSGENKYSDIPNLVFRNADGGIEKSKKTYCASEKELDEFDFTDPAALKNHKVYYSSTNVSAFAAYYPLPNKAPSVMQLCVGRGCPHNCINCGASRQSLGATSFSIQARYRSVDRVTNEIIKMHSLGYHCFSITYNPAPEFQYYLDLFKSIRQKKICIGLCFDCWFLPPKEFVDAFSQTFDLRFSAINLTIESGNSRIRKQIGKIELSNDGIIELVKYINTKGISINAHFSLGMPGENRQDVEETVRLIKRIQSQKNRVIINSIPIEPKSPLAVFAKNLGVQVYRCTLAEYIDFAREMSQLDYPKHPLGYRTQDFSEEELLKLKLVIFRKCYLTLGSLYFLIRENSERKRFIQKLLCGIGIILLSPRLFYKHNQGTLG
jgi:radical SAM superfamily enzyme YgiQ (UPF0313 family)